MKKLTTLLACTMLAFCMSAVAQTSGANDSQMGNGNMNSSDHMKAHSMTGCISQSGDNFMLMNKKHPDGVQLMSSDDLKPHVGHKVKVMGTMQKDSSGTMMMNVTSVKMISTTCKMGGGGTM